MLFNSGPFFLLFFPLTLVIYFLLAPRSLRAGLAWLGLASLLFYAWWDWRFIGLLLASIAWNYGMGMRIHRKHAMGQQEAARRAMILGIVVDVALLGFFKYFNFFVENLNLAGFDWNPGFQVILPLGISFFTFTQIAFLVDAAQGKIQSKSPISYLLFVTYFPHLIAGPILHHGPMIRQFEGSILRRPAWTATAIGLLWFTFGLLKKVVLADGIQAYAAEAFVGELGNIGFSRAWQGALAYTFQIYFDFSGYTDMAIGLSLILGVALPFNFYSPYKSTSIIEFWRRWHISLSTFLRDYIYIPLGGSRRGTSRRYTNLMATMLIGGIWHGAGWAFLLWGALHGFYLMVNHGWRHLTGTHPWLRAIISSPIAWLITFVAVVAAWVPFRLENLQDSLHVLEAMFGFRGVSFPESWSASSLAPFLSRVGITFNEVFPLDRGGWTFLSWAVVCGLIAFLAPNSQQLSKFVAARLDSLSERRRANASVFLCGILCTLSVVLIMISSSFGASEFLYFNF